MDNLEDKLEITKDTTKNEIIDYAIRLYEKYNPNDLTEEKIRETKEKIREYAGNVWKHSKSVHYYLDKLGISIKNFKEQHEIETPHDLAGKGNKLEWDVMKGFLYTEEEKNDDPEKKKIFEKSLEIHRWQMHHKNGNNPKLPEWLKYGAIDAVCSLLEKRDYQNGVHYWDEILDVISSCSSEEYQKEKHKKEKMIWAVEEMQKVTPLLKDLKIMMASFLNENKKNSEENNNNSN